MTGKAAEANAMGPQAAGAAGGAGAAEAAGAAGVAGTAKAASAAEATPAQATAAEAADATAPDADHVPVFSDALFRKKRKKGKYSLVEPPAPPLEAPIADTHAHVHLLWDPAGALACAGVWNVGFVCDVVDTVEDDPAVWDAMGGWRSQAAERLAAYAQAAAETYGAAALPANPAVPDVRFIAGCHPHNAKDYDEAAEAALLARLVDPRVAALGEIGLDYYYDFSPRDVQKDVFRRQLRLARECGLPVSLHLREAHDDAYRILCDEGFPPAGTLLHCFNLDKQVLAPFLEAGCFIAFGGPVTFKAADEVREAARLVPLGRLLTETDSPYMTPEPMRGMICGPAHTVFTAARLAEVFGCASGADREAFLGRLWENAHDLLDRRPTAWQLAHATSVGEARS
ncbi:TatD family hydrolase [Xiamenia xianingshaonis]|uniref:TatD family hydrolase n=1 Tax=Xiamenia xianingshaonis TaxID=2682776 RepID=UPI0021BDBB61|nr:TatD family hydrolase [Xiamenia xianingshaonis]